jgi:hypothetical protein
MIRIFVLTVLSLSFAVQVYSQKVHRAAKAMNELKFDKSFELFEEVLQKDSNNIVALIGYAKAQVKQNELTNNPISQELLQVCYDYLSRSKTITSVKEEDAKVLLMDQIVYDEFSVDTLQKKISNLIWNNYIKEETSIAKFEFFQSNYYIANNLNPAKLVGYKLDKLYFDSLSKENTIVAYNYYINKFDKSKNVKGNYSNDAKSKILGLEYKNAFEASGIEKLNQFISKNKSIAFEGVAKTTYEVNQKLATKEIHKREYQKAIAAPGVELLEAFITNYKSSEQYLVAKDSIENRYYQKAKASHKLSDYETFLNKYAKSNFRNEIEDTVASFNFRNTIQSTIKVELSNFIEKSLKFHKSTLIQGFIDSTKTKIYDLEYIEATNSNELTTILTFYKKYKQSAYPNVALIKTKLFTTWEQAIIKPNSDPQENGLLNFIHEFNLEPATAFNKVIDATKTFLFAYAVNLKSKLVANVISTANKNSSNIYSTLSSEKLESLCALIGGRLNFKNTTSNATIFENLKNIDPKVNPNTLELFNQFFINFTVSNSYIQSIYETSDQGFIFGYQTNEKFVTKLLLWDDTELKYKEIDPSQKDNNLLKIFMYQNGITNISNFINNLPTIYNYVVIGSKINKEAILNLSITKYN